LLLKWGKDNSIEISDKIEMNYISENNKTYISKEKIFENEIILNIPNSVALSVENAIKLYGKKAEKLYEEFKSYNNETNNFFLLDQQFLAYMMYRVNKNNKTKNNDFYKYYQYLFNTFETNLDSYPIFYNLEKLYLTKFTSLSYLIDYLKKMYKTEIDILEKEFKIKKINKDEYYVFRTYSSSKSYNISGHCVILPFVDMFYRHPTNYNLRVEADENSAKVIATRDILPYETLYINYGNLTNHNALTLFGISFDEIIDKITTFHIPILNPVLLDNHNKTNKNLYYYFYEYMEISKDNFYTKYIEKYKKISLELEGDGTELSAYKLILENLETIKEHNNSIKSSVYKIFYMKKDIDNILRLFKSDNKYLTKKINKMKIIISDYENEIKSTNKDDL
jgi:hypothetical protein